MIKNKIHPALYAAALWFACPGLLLLLIIQPPHKDKEHLGNTKNITAEYDIPKELDGCRVYKVVNVENAAKSFYTLQCK